MHPEKLPSNLLNLPARSAPAASANLSILFARVAGLGSALVGVLVLLGWKFNFVFLIRLRPELASMKTVTATSVLLVGLSLWCLSYESVRPWKTRVGTFFAALALTIASTMVLQSAFRIDLGVDHLIARVLGSPAAMASLQRPPVTANLCISFLALALLFLRRKTYLFYPSQLLALLSSTMGIAALVGYALNIKALYSIPGYTSTSPQTATTIVALSFGVLFARPRVGVMAALNLDTADGSWPGACCRPPSSSRFSLPACARAARPWVSMTLR